MNVGIIAQNRGSPAFWTALGIVATLAAIINFTVYRRTRFRNSDQRNSLLKSSVFVVIAWATICFGRLTLI
jgi:hypothetical protein